MAWSEVRFGKHKGKTLPQIVFNDPDWFFWAVEEDVFKGSLAREAKQVDAMARAIRIPGNKDGALTAEYYLHPPANKFARMEIVPVSQPQHDGSSPTFRKSVIDLSVPRSIANYDKLGCRLLLTSVKSVLFGRRARITKQLCETFFDDPSNFDL